MQEAEVTPRVLPPTRILGRRRTKFYHNHRLACQPSRAVGEEVACPNRPVSCPGQLEAHHIPTTTPTRTLTTITIMTSWIMTASGIPCFLLTFVCEKPIFIENAFCGGKGFKKLTNAEMRSNDHSFARHREFSFDFETSIYFLFHKIQ